LKTFLTDICAIPKAEVDSFTALYNMLSNFYAMQYTKYETLEGSRAFDRIKQHMYSVLGEKATEKIMHLTTFMDKTWQLEKRGGKDIIWDTWVDRVEHDKIVYGMPVVANEEVNVPIL
jgi:hypothetical protein